MKIGFWALFALVTGSQIGSGVLMLPANLAPFGWYSLLGWGFSAIGALALALVFSKMCTWFPKTGGPHVYIHQAFGKDAAFFTGWTYWVVSWVSTTAVVVASAGYLSPLFGPFSPTQMLGVEAILLFCVAALNWKGVHAAGSMEKIFTLLKFIPLVILPCIGIFYFNPQNIQISAAVAEMSGTSIVSRVLLLTLWGFIGLESGTIAAESVENPTKTIPKAVVFGTLSVAILYLFNSLGVLGAVPASALEHSKAPYADMAQSLLGGSWYLMVSLIASILCLGTLNAWTLASSQIALGLAHDQLLPKIFGKTNRNGAPYWSLLISAAGILPLLYGTTHSSVSEQLAQIIDFSVVAFLYVYLISCFAFIRLLKIRKESSIFEYALGTIAVLFCVLALSQVGWKTLLLSTLFILTGLPIWFFRNRNRMGF
ncbi:MAG: amino acid permease [Myxococcaceae bacterium]|nr:amino acid permease [Myxococcaceae bacterium]